ncbi:MAG: HD domain-containing protein [bacterium]
MPQTVYGQRSIFRNLYNLLAHRQVPGAVRRRALARRAHDACLSSMSSVSSPLHVGLRGETKTGKPIDFYPLIPADYQKIINELCAGYLPEESSEVGRAFDFMMRAHMGVARDSGEPYFFHPVAVATIVKTKQKGTFREIMAALLHDTVEDAKIWQRNVAGGYDEVKITEEMIGELFGAEVEEIVRGLTELGKEPGHEGYKPSIAEKFRKLISYAIKNPSVIKIKLADRLHNMRTLHSMPVEKQLPKAEETMKVYARLANRLGAWEIKRELEDLSYQYLNPATFAAINVQREALIKESKEQIIQIAADLQQQLSSPRAPVEVFVEKREIYELHVRMKNRGIESVKDLTPVDIWRLEVVSAKESDCYRELRKLHALFPPDQTDEGSRFKDHIAAPRPNGHKFIHTYVLVPDFGSLLVQFRDREMYEYYKLGRLLLGVSVDHDAWRPAMEALLADLRHAADISSNEFFSLVDTFCASRTYFGPDGREVSLRHGATALDFIAALKPSAFKFAESATLNGKPIGLTTPLRDGGHIKITFTFSPQARLDWLEHLGTKKAKALLKHHLSRLTKLHPIEARRVAEKALANALTAGDDPFFMGVDELLKSKLFLRFISGKKRGPDAHALLSKVASGKLEARMVVAEFRAFYGTEKQKAVTTGTRVLPYYFALDVPDQIGAVARVLDPLSDAGYNLREIDSDNPRGSEAGARIMLALDIIGGRKGGTELGQFQRLEVSSIVEKSGARLTEMSRDDVLTFLLSKAKRLIAELHLDDRTVREFLALLESAVIERGLEDVFMPFLLGMLQRFAQIKGFTISLRPST